MPSIYEPFGLVALEAMASGCPCIVADTGGLREVVPGGGRVGLRFRPKDAKALGRMAEQILTDDALRDRLVAEAREHVLRFDWTDVARQTAKVYARPRRRRHDRVGADHRPGRDPRARPERRVRADPRPVADRDRPRRGGCSLIGTSTSAPSARVGEHGPLADGRAVADRDLRQRDDHAARADPGARADRDRPAGRLDPAARREQAAVAEPHAAAVGRAIRTPRPTCTSRPASSAPRARRPQPREAQPRGDRAAARRHDRIGADRRVGGHASDSSTPRLSAPGRVPITGM